MTLINVVLAFVVALGFISIATKPSILAGVTIVSGYVALWAVQPILVYIWAKEYNKKLESKSTVNT